MTVTRHAPTVPTPSLGTLAWMALVLATIADLATTAVGLQLGATESNPIGRAALDQGVVGVVVLKAGIVLALGGVTAWLSGSDRMVALYIPAGVATCWALAACWNAVLLLTAL